MWNHRNKFLHEIDRDEDLLGIATLNNTITKLHNDGPLPLMMPDEKELFKMPLPSLLNMPLQRKQAWVDKVEAAIVLHQDRDRSYVQQERQLLRTWLQSSQQQNG